MNQITSWFSQVALKAATYRILIHLTSVIVWRVDVILGYIFRGDVVHMQVGRDDVIHGHISRDDVTDVYSSHDNVTHVYISRDNVINVHICKSEKWKKDIPGKNGWVLF